MSLIRIALVIVLFAVTLVGHAVTFVDRHEYWPFSAYPLYSNIDGPNTHTVKLYGITEQGASVQLMNEHIHPFNHTKITRFVDKLVEDRGALAGPIAVAQFIERYEELRRRGRHQGPAIVAMHAEQLRWRLEPFARNVGSPEKRRKVFEGTRMPETVRAALHGTIDMERTSIAAADVLLAASTAHIGGTARKIDDPGAAEGSSIELADPEAYAEYEFRALAGSYHLWIRGRGHAGSSDALRVQLDRRIGTAKALGHRRHGMGNFHMLFPSDVYGWSSAMPLAPGVSVELVGDGPHRIRVGTRGAVRIDQIWLSSSQIGAPAFTAPVRAAQ